MSNYKPPMMSIMNCHHIQSILTVSSGNGIEATREDYTYCGEETWEEDPGVLLDGIQWQPRKLQEIQAFLDQVNDIIKPIGSECDLTNESNYENHWYLTTQPFGYATMINSGDGFKIVGIVFD